MSDYKEFTGKTLDEAIEAACSHFSLDRGKLEIEIVSGGSSGIFGLVGKKKAMVKARPRATPAMNGQPQGRQGGAQRQDRPARTESPKAEPKRDDPARTEEPAAPVAAERPKAQAEKPAPQPVPQSAPGGNDVEDFDEFDEDADEINYNRAPEEEERPLDDKALEALITEAVQRLIEPIVGPQELEIIQTRDRIKVIILGEESAGLLIGREGQTINALQYLVSRIVAKQRPDEQIKIQLDAGQYRERQDDKLRQMALYLADKARQFGRAQSTKPLSSYHRRVVHLALQSDASISTRSKGEGPLKRVLIMPRRERGQPR